MHFGNKQLILTSHAPEMGEAEVHLDLPEYDGEEIEIGFNPNYLSDALKVIDQEGGHLRNEGIEQAGRHTNGQGIHLCPHAGKPVLIANCCNQY